MTEQKVLSRLKKALENDTPDKLADILLACKELDSKLEKGELPMETTATQVVKNNKIIDMRATRPKKNTKAMIGKWLLTAAAFVLLTLGGNFAYQHYTVDWIMGIDINPSLELSVNRAEKVLAAKPLNEEALIILDEMNLKNVDLDVAVNALIGSMLKHGYLDQVKNSILISVENGDEQKSAALKKRFSEQVNQLLKSHSFNGAVLSQSVHKNERLEKMAKEHGISMGKAALIDLLVGSVDEFSFAGLAELSINDLNLLIEGRKLSLQEVSSSGQASSSAYITKTKAKQIALNHAGLSEAAISFSKVKLDYEDGRMIYEVEFYTAEKEYEYDIDAVSGQILDVEIEQRKQSQGSDQGSSQEQTPGTATYIGEARAKQIALNHAGLNEAMVRFIKVEQEYEKGRLIYEVEFGTADMKYEYEIDAITGDIIEVEQEQRKQSQASAESTAPSNQGSASNSPAPDNSTTESYISEEKAIQIALNHAGLSRGAVRSLETKREYEKGRLIYEVEFKHGGYEYEYEIDAVTGRILEVEKERD